MLGAVLSEPIAGQAGAILDHAAAHGLLLLQAGPDVLRFVPPLTITDDELAKAWRVCTPRCARSSQSSEPPIRSRPMKYLHSMVRVRDLDASLRFYCDGLGLQRSPPQRGAGRQVHAGVFGRAGKPEARDRADLQLGLAEDYGAARNFGHLAFRVDDIYATCARLQAMGYTIHRPPRDGHMAFVRSPDLISIELLQEGHLPPQEPWASMPNTGSW